MKQRSIREYTESPLRDYNIVSTEWLGKTGNVSPVSTKMKTRTRSQKSRSQKPSPRKPITESSPLGKWIQHKTYNHDNDNNGKNTTKLDVKQVIRNDESEKCDVEFLDVDDILKNIDLLNKEGKILETCDDLFEEKDLTIPSSMKLSSDHAKKDSASSNMKTRSLNTKYRNKTKKSFPQKPIAEAMSPLQIWIQRKNCEKLQSKDKNTSKLNKIPFTKRDSFEKYGVILPTVDDILKNRDTMEEEGRILDDYNDIFDESDISFPSSLKSLLDSPEKISTIPLLTCDHLSELQLKMYFLKYLDSLKNISEGVEFSRRHQTYKDYSSRSKLTYSFSTVVFTASQLEYLMKKIEKALDPEEKRTDYLFMVILPELCLKICMDEFDMSKEEAVDYLNRRPVD